MVWEGAVVELGETIKGGLGAFGLERLAYASPEITEKLNFHPRHHACGT